MRVDAVGPGPIDSGILEAPMPREAAERAKVQTAAENPVLRLDTSAEVARAVAFLAFEATFTTGAELAVDGGGSML
nr:SDR family oxidoreductase [Streptomyces ruber]